MKRFVYALTLITLFSSTSFSQDQEIDPTEDSIKVAAAVVQWADDTFYSHSEYKFDHFHAFYTEEFFIATMRSRMYKERLDLLEQKKKTGRYQKSDDEYAKEHEEMESAYLRVQSELDSMYNRVTHYEIHFWSNIQTNDGITVYYEHIVKLDNDYKVTEAVINSAIGKKSDKTEILYKKDVKSEKKK